MFNKHVSSQLTPYIETGRDATRVERHLTECAHCRDEYAQVLNGIAALKSLPLVEAPPSIWISIESAIDRPPERKAPWRFAFALLAALIVAGVTYSIVTRSHARWEVDGLSGSPVVASQHIGQSGSVTAGEWVETDAQSRARIAIGNIGTVVLEPNTRARMVAARPHENRIALAHGEIHAVISAPPKLFFVDTASGTAVDLGCEYSLSSADDGTGLLQVTRGWVSFQNKGRESLVPAGASCRTRPHAPGTPYFDDASDQLKKALDLYDETSRVDDLEVILSAARVRDTLTLWHLISRVDAADRGRVFDRIAALTPLPAGISKEKVLHLDPEMLNHWKDELAWTW